MPREAEVVRGDFVFGSVRAWVLRGPRAIWTWKGLGDFFSLSFSFRFLSLSFSPFSLLFFWQISCFLL